MHTRFGCIDLAPETKMLKVKADQFFRHDGVNAVVIEAGYVRLALSADAKIDGIAIVPKGKGAGSDSNYWKSQATNGLDEIPVIPANKGYKFLLPGSTTVTQAMIGTEVDLTAVNDGAATSVNLGASATDVFRVADLGTNVKSDAIATDVVVKINKY